MIIGINSIITLYQFFYSKKYNSPKYKFKPTVQAISKMNDFLKSLDQQYSLLSLGPVFLSNYFMFQFNRTHGQVFQRFASRDSGGGLKVAGKIQIYDVIGKQALKYWNERDMSYDFVLQNCQFAQTHGINIFQVRTLIEEKEQNRQSVLQSEEIEKSRYLNTSRGILNCIERTSLYNHKSYNCLVCKEKVVCKKVLENNYYHIFEERGYGKTA